jgi:hypothetical protein
LTIFGVAVGKVFKEEGAWMQITILGISRRGVEKCFLDGLFHRMSVIAIFRQLTFASRDWKARVQLGVEVAGTLRIGNPWP